MFVNFKLEAQNLLNINKIRQPDYSGMELILQG